MTGLQTTPTRAAVMQDRVNFLKRLETLLDRWEAIRSDVVAGIEQMDQTLNSVAYQFSEETKEEIANCLKQLEQLTPNEAWRQRYERLEAAFSALDVLHQNYLLDELQSGELERRYGAPQ